MSAADNFERALIQHRYRFNREIIDYMDVFELKADMPGDRTIFMRFLFDDNSVTYGISNIAKVEDEYKLDEIRKLVCRINCEYRWIKLIINEDNVIFAMNEHFVTDEYDMSELIIENGQQFLGVVQEVYPDIMKVVWG